MNNNLKAPYIGLLSKHDLNNKNVFSPYGGKESFKKDLVAYYLENHPNGSEEDFNNRWDNAPSTSTIDQIFK